MATLVRQALVSAVRPDGGYDVVSLAVPPDPLWEAARPGQLLVVPGDPAAGAVLPRVLWLAGVELDPLHGTTVQVVLPEEDSWAAGQVVRMLGPLGRGFALPAHPVDVVLVAHEASGAPLRWLVQLLRERGCPAHVLLLADDPDRRIDPGALRRSAARVVLAPTPRLGPALDELLDASDPELVLATGPAGVVRGVAQRSAGRVVRVTAVDPAAGVVCGTGLCGACDVLVPRGGQEREARRARACLEGPVVPGEWVLGEESPAAQEVRGAAR